LVLVNGGDGQEYGRVALTGSLAGGGYLALDVEAQNGAPDGVALVATASGTLLDALSYEGEIHAAAIDGQTHDLVEGTALADTVADSNTVAGSLSRIPDGTDSNNAATDWAFTTTLTKGAANVASS
jgi:large repetitive protein